MLHFLSLNRILLIISIFLYTPISCMSNNEYEQYLEVIEQPINHINTVMRKYHQYNITHSNIRTHKDIESLKQIFKNLDTYSQQQQQDIKNEFFGVSLFILFFARPYVETSLYIDTLLQKIPCLSKELATPPTFHNNVQNNQLCTSIVNSWQKLQPHEQLIIKNLSLINNQYFYFGTPFVQDAPKLVRRLILFVMAYKTFRKNSLFQSIKAFTDTMQEYTLKLSTYKHIHLWNDFNCILNHDHRLDFILIDDIDSLLSYTIAYNPNEASSYITFLMLNPPNQITHQHYTINHLAAAAQLGALQTFNILINDFKINENIVDKALLFTSSLISNNNDIFTYTKHTLYPTEGLEFYGKEAYTIACIYDRTSAINHIKNYGFAQGIEPFNLEKNPHYPTSVISQLSVHSINENAILHKHMYEPVENLIPINIAVFYGLNAQKITPLKTIYATTNLLTETPPDFHEALAYLHRKIPFHNYVNSNIKNRPNSIRAYNNKISVKINSLYEKYKDNKTALRFLDKELIGHIINNIFFTAPYDDVCTYCDTLITYVPKLAQLANTNTPSMQAYNNIHKPRTIAPWIALIINQISPESLKIINLSIEELLCLVKLQRQESAQPPFYTYTGFKRYIKELETVSLSPQSNIALNFYKEKTSLSLHANKIHITQDAPAEPTMKNIICGSNLNEIISYIQSIKKTLDNNEELRIQLLNLAIKNYNYHIINFLQENYDDAYPYNKHSFDEKYTYNINPLTEIPIYTILCIPIFQDFQNKLYDQQTTDVIKKITQHIRYAQQEGAYYQLLCLYEYSKKYNITIPGLLKTTNKRLLYNALSQNDTTLIDNLLANDISGDAKTYFNAHPENLSAASKCNNVTVAQHYLDAGISFTTLNAHGTTPLKLAYIYENYEMLKLFLTHNEKTLKIPLQIKDFIVLQNNNNDITFEDYERFFEKLIINQKTRILKLLIHHHILTNTKGQDQYKLLKLLLLFAAKDTQFFISIFKKIQKTYPKKKWLDCSLPAGSIHLTYPGATLHLIDFAIAQKNISLLEWLLHNNAKVHNTFALEETMHHAWYKAIRILAPYYAHESFYIINEYKTPLHMCIVKKNIKAAKILCDALMQKPTPPPFLHNIIKFLHNPAENDDTFTKEYTSKANAFLWDIIHYIIAKRPEYIFQKNLSQETPLHMLAQKAYETSFLIPFMKLDCFTHQALHNAIEHDTNHLGETPLLQAVAHNNKAFLKYALLTFPIDINKKFPLLNNTTLLHKALESKSFNCIKLLLKHMHTTHTTPKDDFSLLGLFLALKNNTLKEYALAQEHKLNLENQYQTSKENKQIIMLPEINFTQNAIAEIESTLKILEKSEQLLHYIKPTISTHDFIKALNTHQSNKIIAMINQGLNIFEHHENQGPLLFLLFGKDFHEEIVTTILSNYDINTLFSTKNHQEIPLWRSLLLDQNIKLIATIFSHPCAQKINPNIIPEMLFWAIKNNFFSFVTLLYEGKYDEKSISSYCNPQLASIRDEEKNTPLHLAILHNHQHIAHYLIDQENCKLNMINQNKITPYMLAIEKQYDEVANHLLRRFEEKYKTHPFSKFSNNNLTLYHATRLNYLNLMRECMKYTTKTIINKTVYKGDKTPLLIAIENKNPEAVHLLLEHGADADLLDTYNTLPLEHALHKKNNDIIMMLWNKTTRLNNQNKNGDSLAHEAVIYNNFDILQKLHAKNISLKMLNNQQQTPLALAQIMPIKTQNPAIIHFLQTH